MPAVANALALTSEAIFPLAEVQVRLRKELEEAEAESGLLHSGWQPVLDSLRMVTAVTAVEDLFDFKLSPEKVVRKGGYGSVAEGVNDMSRRIQGIWEKRNR